jgi:undecaprenyl diphosphate synthase
MSSSTRAATADSDSPRRCSVSIPASPVNEATVAEALYAPADCEPDLIVVLGESTRLPPSLVWELAYGELVFHPMEWHELSPDHLLEAIADFARRQRRFGGIDDDA